MEVAELPRNLREFQLRIFAMTEPQDKEPHLWQQAVSSSEYLGDSNSAICLTRVPSDPCSIAPERASQTLCPSKIERSNGHLEVMEYSLSDCCILNAPKA